MATEFSAETRDRILTAAWRCVHEAGSSAVTLKDVAAEAGVSRQLLYFHFANRAGLLQAMARHHDRTSGFSERVRATADRPPLEAFDALVREWLDYVPELLPVARALEAAHVTGDAGGVAWRDRMADLWRVVHAAVARLEDAGCLGPGWAVDTAADWTWARVQPSTYAHLVQERAWPHGDFVARTVASLHADLLAPAPP